MISDAAVISVLVPDLKTKRIVTKILFHNQVKLSNSTDQYSSRKSETIKVFWWFQAEQQ